MRFHWQNLNDTPMGRKGSPWKHMRFWFGKLGVEWLFWSKSFHLGFSVGGDHTWAIGFCPVIFSLWVRWDRTRSLSEEHDCNIYWLHYSLWIHLWCDPMGSNSKDPWWKRSIVFHFDDIVFGKAQYSTQALKIVETFIPMPEGSYPATVTMELATWKRPRWFTKTLLCGNVEIPEGIPVEGKGENAWDCGEDAVYGYSVLAPSVEDAIAAVVRSVLHDRQRYGSPSRLRVLTATGKS